MASFAPKIAYPADLARVTTSFDVRHASAVLKAASKAFTAGFGRGETEKVMHDIDGMKADQTRSWSFAPLYQGKPVPLEIRAQLDDLGMIDLDFATAPEAAPALRAAVDGYLNTRGR